MREVMAEFSREEGRYPTKEETIAFLARKVLETDIVGKFTKKSERERAIYDLIFQICPRCEQGLMHTEDGPIEISHEHIEAIKEEARIVEISHEDYVRGEALPAGEIDDQDIPNGVKLVAMTRDKKACARCGSGIDLHRCMYILFNGIFIVLRSKRLFRSSGAEPGLICEPPSRRRPLRQHAGGSPAMSPVAERIIPALMKITDHSKEEARARVMKALQLLSSLGRAPTPDEIFTTAFYGKIFESGGSVRGCGNGRQGPESPQNGASKPPESTEKPETGDTK